jgi:hypothetical protein
VKISTLGSTDISPVLRLFRQRFQSGNSEIRIRMVVIIVTTLETATATAYALMLESSVPLSVRSEMAETDPLGF